MRYIKRMRLATLALLLVFIVGVACKSDKIKDVKGINYVPSEKGFGYKQATFTEGDFQKWFKKNKGKLDKEMGKLGDDFMFVVIGHTDKCGPEIAKGNKKGNNYYATRRAENFRKRLIRAGYPARKIRAVGVASEKSRTPSNCEYRHVDRRVTFGIARKAAK